ncbi:hypothetical protein AVEN_186711-1 [Araneus ventricosus]|uniref:Uncharacterized protein n=1 Tax=Araneus ventricosus TaxID=182803 RepID=A0A4Y2NBF7_ARAVE|nr:hypothetical protein AVEN_91377-1 [Araneus ventricosus]GBN35978.1 hypothetical protein AVEN_114304-1 [Araneus ventricosus]GBN35995.1 hypothetical protein AVEN_147290-1 [Araneus ventricosus]GBN36004.1 hypothetical protein AVEN_186711-1 [Araneus ventricosus]
MHAQNELAMASSCPNGTTTCPTILVSCKPTLMNRMIVAREHPSPSQTTDCSRADTPPAEDLFEKAIRMFPERWKNMLTPHRNALKTDMWK